jgi:IS5 family transposase
MRSHQETTRTNLRIRGLCPGEYPLSSGLRPIIRGKVKTSVEFGAKLDLSIDEEGYARIETISFNAYNESAHLQEESSGIMSAQEVILSVYWWTRFTGPEQTGTFVKIKGSGFQAQNLEGQVNRNRQKQKYQDNTDRIEIERECSVEKRSYGLGLIVTRLETTQLIC